MAVWIVWQAWHYQEVEDREANGHRQKSNWHEQLVSLLWRVYTDLIVLIWASWIEKLGRLESVNVK